MSEDELEAWIAANPEKFRPEPVIRPDLQLADAKQAISELHRMSMDGNFQAMESIVEIGIHVADLLTYIFTCTHTAHPIHQTASIVAENSHRWPVALPAIEKLQEVVKRESLPACLADALALKKRGGVGLDHPGQTRLAFDIYHVLEGRRLKKRGFKTGGDWEALAAVLEPLSKATLPSWTHAGWKLMKAEFNSKPNLFFVTPPEFLAAVQTYHERQKKSIETAFKAVSKEWLKAGFKRNMEKES